MHQEIFSKRTVNLFNFGAVMIFDFRERGPGPGEETEVRKSARLKARQHLSNKSGGGGLSLLPYGRSSKGVRARHRFFFFFLLG